MNYLETFGGRSIESRNIHNHLIQTLTFYCTSCTVLYKDVELIQAITVFLSKHAAIIAACHFGTRGDPNMNGGRNSYRTRALCRRTGTPWFSAWNVVVRASQVETMPTAS